MRNLPEKQPSQSRLPQKHTLLGKMGETGKSMGMGEWPRTSRVAIGCVLSVLRCCVADSKGVIFLSARAVPLFRVRDASRRSIPPCGYRRFRFRLKML
jgi:hypothetical protein